MKGRSTTVISIRLPDEAVKKLKTKAKAKGLTLSEYLKSNALYQSVLPDEAVIEETNLPASNISQNAPCPCGAKYPDGNFMEYKHCCGKQNKLKGGENDVREPDIIFT